MDGVEGEISVLLFLLFRTSEMLCLVEGVFFSYDVLLLLLVFDYWIIPLLVFPTLA